ncbi:MAG: hypothetical protein ACXWD8_17515 [Mycobacterium sp.]
MRDPNAITQVTRNPIGRGADRCAVDGVTAVLVINLPFMPLLTAGADLFLDELDPNGSQIV